MYFPRRSSINPPSHTAQATDTSVRELGEEAGSHVDRASRASIAQIHDLSPDLSVVVPDADGVPAESTACIIGRSERDDELVIGVGVLGVLSAICPGTGLVVRNMWASLTSQAPRPVSYQVPSPTPLARAAVGIMALLSTEAGAAMTEGAKEARIVVRFILKCLIAVAGGRLSGAGSGLGVGDSIRLSIKGVLDAV